MMCDRRGTEATKWDIMSMGRLVRGLRGQLDLPAFFTLDSCRHGGMTELEEAELNDGPGPRALGAPLQGLCQAHRKARLGCDPEAPRAPCLDREGRRGSQRTGCGGRNRLVIPGVGAR